MTIKKTLLFSRDEFLNRLCCVRRQMGEKGIEVLALFSPASSFYLTGFNTIGVRNYQLLLVPLEDDPILLTRQLETYAAVKTSWLNEDRVLGWEDTENPVEKSVQVLKEYGLFEKRIGLEGSAPFLSADRFIKIRDALPNPTMGTGLVEWCRRTKSAQEIVYMRKAAEITQAGVSAAIAAIVPGASENDVAAATYAALMHAGSEKPPGGPTITSGEKAGIPHTTFARRILMTGDTVLLELSGCYNYYVGPIMRGVSVGTPSRAVAHMADTLIRALNAGIEAIKPGHTVAEVDEACKTIIESNGFRDNFRKRTGYSVGFSFGPGWNEGDIISLQANDPTIMEPGMVFHLPLALRVYDQYGLAFSETVVVTETGHELLTDYPRVLFVK